MLRGGTLKRVYELHGAGQSVRAIAQQLGIARNTVRKFLRAPAVLQPAPRPRRASKLAPYVPYIQQSLADGVDNCAVLLREWRAQSYTGGHTILRAYVQQLRRPRPGPATVRFETEPGEQAQVDWGLLRYRTADGQERSLWVFVLVLSWSRAMYVECTVRADVATFIRCHVHTFAALGGVPRQCLYDNAKVVVLERPPDADPVWNPRFLDFALRVGFAIAIRLCQPYRPQTQGRVEAGVKYVKHNFWPSARFTDLADLNAHVGGHGGPSAGPRDHP